MFNDKMAEVIRWGKGQDPATNEIKGQQLCHLQKVKRSEVHVSLRWEAGMIVYWWFYVAFNTVQAISRRVVGRAEETST